MIPKTIHYCWFGGNPLPASAQQCIASWRRFLPDYEIKEWNETNFDVGAIAYTRDAYAAKKYAFVSDYARFKILYEQGGIYFDTDVEAIKRFDSLLIRGPFMGWETQSKAGGYFVNPGLALASTPKMAVYREILSGFERLNYYTDDGQFNHYTMIPLVTDILKAHGLVQDGTTQTVAGLTVYAPDYFCPLNYLTGKLLITAHTHSIHHYTMSWIDPWTQRRARLMRSVRSLLGMEKYNWLKKKLRL